MEKAPSKKLLHFLKKEYGGHLTGDLSGGITTAVVALPLALAFAIASGVDAKYGLYTAIIAGIVAAVVGGSKVQVSGPTGGMAAVLISVTSQFGYEKVVLIGLLAGMFQIATGALKLGRFVKMLPFPLVAGFTMGIGIVIFGGQVDHAMGVHVQHHQTEFYDRLRESFQAAAIQGVSWASIGIAAFTIIATMLLGWVSHRLPAALLAVIAAAIGSWVFGLNITHIKDIPRHLPVPQFPAFSWDMFRELLRPAATVAALGAIESLLAAVVADNILGDGSRHHSNRELIGQGCANIASSFFGGIPCTGAIARTAVNIRSGGRTRLAAIIHSLVLLAAMLFLAPLAVHIPIAALAGVLMLTAVRMVEWREAFWLLKAPRSDIAIMAVTVIVTVFTDLVMAVEFGLAAAAILFIRKMAAVAPQMLPDESAEESHKSGHGRIRVFRIPGPLFWGDSHAIVEAIEECTDVSVVILKMQFVTHIDASGISTLREAKSRLDRRKIKLFLVNIPDKTYRAMHKMGVVDEIRTNNIFPSLEAAKAAAMKMAS
jgi:SulP family sulfate permease